MSGRKPMSNMRSASSSTTISQPAPDQRAAAHQVQHAAGRAHDERRRRRRPARSACGSACRRRRPRWHGCGPGPASRTRRGPARPVRGSARAPGPAAARRGCCGWSCSRMGMAKAAVLPVPVCAWPITSTPASARGMKPFLHGRGLFVSGGGQGIEHHRAKPQRGERRHYALCARARGNAALSSRHFPRAVRLQVARGVFLAWLLRLPVLARGRGFSRDGC